MDGIDILVGFNIKFDLHWLRRYGLRFEHCRIWDCQLVEFILAAQSTPYPSLDGVCSVYGLGNKLDFIKSNYWDKGIDTDAIPWIELAEYLGVDLDLTWKLREHQLKLLVDSPQLMRLINLHNQDLLVLQEMEYNGTKIDWSRLNEKRHETEQALIRVDAAIAPYLGGFEHFNPASEDHISALLYGGEITVKIGTPYQHTYKGGLKAGTVETRNKWTQISYTFPRLVEPLPGSELKKEGVWSTDDKVLRRLKAKKDVRNLIELLRERADYSKLLDTYYCGLPDLCREMDWQDGLVHGQLNQCVVATGRLSSSKPNMQNLDGRMEELIVTRF